MDTDNETPIKGVVKIGKRWEFGTLGKATDLKNLHKIWYENSRGATVSVVRDITDADHWREGLDVLPEDDVPVITKDRAPKVKVAKTKVVKDPNEIVQYATGSTKRGSNKFPADKAWHVCTGECGQRLIGKKFPTVSSNSEFRVSECRNCRDARRGQVKDKKSAA